MATLEFATVTFLKDIMEHLNHMKTEKFSSIYHCMTAFNSLTTNIFDNINAFSNNITRKDLTDYSYERKYKEHKKNEINPDKLQQTLIKTDIIISVQNKIKEEQIEKDNQNQMMLRDNIYSKSNLINIEKKDKSEKEQDWGFLKELVISSPVAIPSQMAEIGKLITNNEYYQIIFTLPFYAFFGFIGEFIKKRDCIDGFISSLVWLIGPTFSLLQLYLLQRKQKNMFDKICIITLFTILLIISFVLIQLLLLCKKGERKGWKAILLDSFKLLKKLLNIIRNTLTKIEMMALLLVCNYLFNISPVYM